MQPPEEKNTRASIMAPSAARRNLRRRSTPIRE
jgi:hypothetical protein